MSTQTVLAHLKQKHAGPSTCEPGSCDACRALEIADQARTALLDLQERVSKSQYDEPSFAAVIQEGLGSTQR